MPPPNTLAALTALARPPAPPSFSPARVAGGSPILRVSSGVCSDGKDGLGGCLSAPPASWLARSSRARSRAWPEGPAAYVAARRLNKLRRYSLRRSAVLRSLASTASLRVRPTRRSVPDLRSARRRSAPDRRSVVPRSIVPGIICLHLCPLHRQTCPLKGRGD